MRLRQLTPRHVTTEALKDINRLLRQLVHDPSTYTAVPMSTFRTIVSNKKTPVVAAFEEGKIVGIGMLVIFSKFRGAYAYVEDMMVDEAYRGRGWGEAIARELMKVARRNKVKTLELSTRPSRVAANKLYQKLGFMQKETNVYRLKL